MVGPKWVGRLAAVLISIGFAVLFCVCPAYAFNAVLDDDIKKHGVELDDKHFIELDETEGWITVILKKRERGLAGDEYVEEDVPGVSVRRIRFMERYPLLRMRVEVMAPAPPNYVRNPGTRYRVMLQGIRVAKDYQRIFEVDAYDALAAVQNELRRFISYSKSAIERDALQMASILALRALNESQHLPAEIPLTVLRSKVGQFRIQGAGLIRGEVHQVRRMTRVKEGVRFVTVLDRQPEMVDMQDPEQVHGPGYRRGQLISADRDVQLQPTPFNPHTRVVEDTPRSGTLQAQRPSAVPIVETQPGQRGKTLHAAPEDLRPVAQAQYETYMSRTRPGRPSKDEVLGLRLGGPVGPKSQRVNLRNQ
jgi:hypothetical protein